MNPSKSSQRSVRQELARSLLAALTVDSNSTGPTVRIARAMLEDACEAGATDVHVEPHRDGSRVRFRIDGSVSDVCHLTVAQGKLLSNQIKAHSGLDPVIRFTPVETRTRFESKVGEVDLRIAIAPAMDGDTIAIRLLYANRRERSIAEIGLSKGYQELLADWLTETNGMFIATGPTGSGKTTTLYAILHELRKTDRIIVSLEDPIEFRVDGISQIQINELHDFQFSDGIKAVLRHDPDCVVVGEIRDAASAETAVSAAVAGRVLLTTLHSRDCVGTVTALRNWGLGDHEIAESLSVVIAQRLVRKCCEDCGQKSRLSDREAAWFHALNLEAPTDLWQAKGCDKCHGLGFKGRIGLFELWRPDDSDYELILSHAEERRIRALLATKGHRFLMHEAVDFLRHGIITFSEARKALAGTIPFTLSATQNERGTDENPG